MHELTEQLTCYSLKKLKFLYAFEIRPENISFWVINMPLTMNKIFLNELIGATINPKSGKSIISAAVASTDFGESALNNSTFSSK